MKLKKECVMERGGIWHVVGGEGDPWFRPILCHDSEGIIAPGPGYEREPTCPECRALTQTEAEGPESVSQGDGLAEFGGVSKEETD